MPFIQPTDSSKRRTRVLINGETGMGKTHSLMTFPGLRAVLNCPGEEGYGTLPENDPQTLVWAFQAGPKDTSLSIVNEFEREMVKILATPGLQTFCLDGIHKLMAYVMDAMSGGAFFEGLKVQTASGSNTETLDPRTWGQAERKMTDLLNIARQSAVPYFVATCWDADKQERKTKPGEQWSAVPTKKLPALYGNIARTVMGEFSVTVHASKGKLKDTDTERTYRWQTQPDGMVMGAQIKAPPEVTAKVPKYVKADWPTLASYLLVGGA
jgi:hypothetical protein